MHSSRSVFLYAYGRMTRYLEWGRDTSDVLLSIFSIFFASAFVWWFVVYQANRWRRRFNTFLSAPAPTLHDPAHDHAQEITRRRLTALRLIVNATKYAIVIGALLMILRRVGVPLDSLLLPAGFAGAALGLGAQNLVRDVVAGLFIVFEGQLAVDDVVTIDNRTGVVQEVGLRVTRLRDENGHDHLIPNGAINVVNKHPRGPAYYMLRLPLPPDDPHNFQTRQHLQTTVEAAVRSFNADYRVLVEKGDNTAIERVEDPQALGDALYWRLCLHPQRALLLETKFPARLKSMLKEGDKQKGAGAEIEIFEAPAPTSSPTIAI